MARRRTLVAAGTVTVLVAAFGIAQLTPGAVPVARAEGLTPYTGCSELLAHYRRELRASATPWGVGIGGYGLLASGGVAMAAGAAEKAAPAAAGPAQDAAVGNGPTGTNLQEQGVDEPDLVKLSDGRLVALAQNRLQVMSAEAKPRLLGSLGLGTRQQPYVSGELLVVGQRALVVSQEYREDPASKTGPADSRMMIYRPGTPTTRLLLLDLAGDQPRLLEEATYDGGYVSARLSGGTVRLVTTSSPRVASTQPDMRYDESAARARADARRSDPEIAVEVGPSEAEQRAAERVSLAANQAAAEAVTLAEVLPQVTRRNAGGTVLGTGDAVSCQQTTHAQDSARGESTLLVTTLRPEVGLGATDSDAVTTDGDLVYASTDRLYVATSRWGTSGDPQPMAVDAVAGEPVKDPPAMAVTSSDQTAPDGASTAVAPTPSDTATATTSPAPSTEPSEQPPANPSASSAPDQVTTELHAFDVSGPTTRYVGSGSVPGYVMGRWALSEDKGVLRVATTRQPAVAAERTRRPAADLLHAREAGRAGRCARRDRPGRGTGQDRAHPGGALLRRPRRGRDVPPDRPALPGRPVRSAEGAGRAQGAGLLDVPAPARQPPAAGARPGGRRAGPGQRQPGVRLRHQRPRRPAAGRPAAARHRLHPGAGRVTRLQLRPAAAAGDVRLFGYDPRGYQGETGALGISVSPTGQLSRVGLMAVAQNAPPQRVLHDADRVYAVSDSGIVAGDPATMTRSGQADFAR